MQLFISSARSRVIPHILKTLHDFEGELRLDQGLMLANLLLLDSLEDYLQERLDVEGLVHELLASQHLLVVQLGLFQVLPNLLLGYLGLSVLVPHAER